MAMAENVVVKYAVYVDKGGDDVLEIVRDSEQEARADKERLKSQTSYIRIEKANIRNFGADDEKVIDSETIDTWESSDGASSNQEDSLSDHYKGSAVDSDNNEGKNDGGNESHIESSPSVAPPVQASLPVPESKPLTWQEHYAKYGALVYAEGWSDLTSAKQEKSESSGLRDGNEKSSGDNNGIEGEVSKSDGANHNPISTQSPASASGTPPAMSPHPPAGSTPVLSEVDVDRIAEKLKQKLSNAVHNNGGMTQPAMQQGQNIPNNNTGSTTITANGNSPAPQSVGS